MKGESWPQLSKDYKERKLEEGGSGKPDMELDGDMLDSLTYRVTKDGIELGFFDSEAWKADGHLKFSGLENNTPQRRFLPGEGQEFRSEIQGEIDRIIADNLAEAAPITKADLSDVSTRSELYELLMPYFQNMTRAEIRAAVLRTSLAELLDDLDLLELL